MKKHKLTNIKHVKVEVAATQVNSLHRSRTATRGQGIASTYEKTWRELVTFMLNLYLQFKKIQVLSNDNLIKSMDGIVTLNYSAFWRLF